MLSGCIGVAELDAKLKTDAFYLLLKTSGCWHFHHVQFDQLILTLAVQIVLQFSATPIG